MKIKWDKAKDLRNTLNILGHTRFLRIWMAKKGIQLENYQYEEQLYQYQVKPYQNSENENMNDEKRKVQSIWNAIILQ